MRFTQVLYILILSIVSCAAIAEQTAADVRLLQSDSNSFSLRTGEYMVEFAPSKNGKGWVEITRTGVKGPAIATKLANGQHLDITDFTGGEASIYQWKDARKDARIFRTLECMDSNDLIQITFDSERQWAKFIGTLTAYKKHPGLLHWNVTATAKEDKAFSGEVEPDCHFMAQNQVSGWDTTVTHPVARYMTQRGPASGIVYFRDVPMNSFVFYFEDLSKLSDLYRLTKCDNPYDYPVSGNPGAVKMGKAESDFQLASTDGNNITPPKPWQEKIESYDKFGYERPASVLIPAGKTLTLGDTYLYLKPADKTDNISICKHFVTMLADVYQFIYKPEVIKTDWAKDVVPQMCKDIMRPENTSVVQDKYFIPRAYINYEHNDTQLWTILQLLQPLELYTQKYPNDKKASELRGRLNAAMPLYYDETYKGFHNNPAPLNPNMFFTVVYIFNPAIMVCDLALAGNENAKKMITGFRDRLVQLGKTCDYVFADVWLADFSKQNSYYQMDGTGSYVYIMMALYELSGGKDTACLDAAKAAAQKIPNRCLDYGWEVNMTAAGVAGCEKLYQATKDAHYRDILYIPLANTLRQAWLWECDYGVGEYTTTFWAFCGTPGAPTSAEYETHRTRVHLKQYCELAGNEMPDQIRTMLNDSWKRGPSQSRYTLPPLLVKAGAQKFMAKEGKSQTNCGVIDYTQMIPLEDVRGGWGTDLEWWQNNTKQGVVGQEIYGAGGMIWYAVWQDELK